MTWQTLGNQNSPGVGDTERLTLIQIPWTFYMLYGKMQANVLLNMEISRSINKSVV